jgi:serine/threonine protein kinase/Tol biopolymer transport system component
MEFSPGRRLGPYEILAPLGAGGMGQVYSAADTRLHRTVAIKILPREKFADAECKRRFLQEARAASALNHPNIITLYDIANDEDVDYMVMEYVPGKSLDKLIAGKKLPLMDVVGYAIEIAGALAAAHAAGIVHRDIKPANVMVTAESHVKVLDFGLAKLVERVPGMEDHTLTLEAPLTESGTVMGTVAYMSPEQARAKILDHRTDIFSLGVVLYEMIAGARPFQRDTPVETMSATINDPAPPLAEQPPELEEILAKALAKDPKERYQHAGDFGLDLRRFLSAWQSKSLPSMRHKFERASKKGWLWMAATFALMLAVPAAWWLGRLRAAGSFENPLANAKFTRLTDFEGAELEAEISPDGRFVAFLSDRDGPFDLWLTQVGTGRFLNLTQGKQGEVLEPTRSTGFSGDGAEIWLRGGPNLDRASIRLMPLMGGPPRPFLPNNSVAVSWSRDGSRIVYHKGVPNGDPIFVADRTGANAKQVFIDPNPGGHCHFPVWSPDGKWIYFVRGTLATSEMDIWRVAPTGGPPERLTNRNTFIASLAPIDVRTLLYVSSAEDGSGPWLYALDLENRTSRRTTYGLEQYLSVAASGDGRRLVATVANPSAGLWRVPILDHPATEGDVKPFVLPTVRALAPRLGAGTLFYLSSLGGGDGLWRYREGQTLEMWRGAESPLLEPPAISADTRRVAILIRRQGKIRVQIMSDDGTGASPLGDGIDARGSASWSPDGKWIAVGGQDAKGPGLFKIPVDGGASIRLSDTAAFNPVWSPDGNMILYSGAAVRRTQPLRALRPDGTAVELPPIRVRYLGERYRFLPNGKGVVYMEGQQRRQDFALLDLATMKSRPLTHLDNPADMRTFDITPDGKEIVFDRLKENSDIVLIDLQK